MVKRARASRPQPVYFPSDDELKALCSKLPKFEPYDTQQILAAAAASAASRGVDLDTAVNEVRDLAQRNQIKELLTAVGCDPQKPDWKGAFLNLATLFCGVGRMVHRGSAGSSPKVWRESDLSLVMEVHRLTGEGLSERKAVERIAEDPRYDDIFPHREQELGRHPASRKRRATALHQRYKRLKRTFKQPWEPFHRVSNFELSLNPPPPLSTLNPPPSKPTESGDK